MILTAEGPGRTRCQLYRSTVLNVTLSTEWTLVIFNACNHNIGSSYSVQPQYTLVCAFLLLREFKSLRMKQVVASLAKW